MPRRVSRMVVLAAVVLAFVVVVHLMPSAPAPPFPSSTAPRFVPASRDWAKVKLFHPPASTKPLPLEPPRSLPRVQAPAGAFGSPTRAAVRRAFKRSYDAYKRHAWMRDELAPVSGGAKDPFGGWAATLVDSLDSLWIMGFDDDFAQASAAVCTIDWAATSAGAANPFETTIRHLGGLLSAYDLSADPVLLAKARELGEMLYHGFDTPNRLPGFWFNFKDARHGSQVAGTNDPSAAAASLSLDPSPWDEERWRKHGDAKLARGFTRVRDARYLLRLEAIESIFVLYRITANPELQDMAWDMFQAIMNSTETPLANSAIADVTVTGETTKTDSMEVSFLLFLALVGAPRRLTFPSPLGARASGWQRRSSTFISSSRRPT